MKAAESKTVAMTNRSADHQPFFCKGEGTFFGSNQIQAKPSFFDTQRSLRHITNRSEIQTKLSIGQPNDKYEQEADSMADRVVQRLSENRQEVTSRNINTVQAKPIAAAASITPLVQAKCASCDEEKLQKKEEEDMGDLVQEKIQNKPIFESNTEQPDNQDIQSKWASYEKDEKIQKQESHRETDEALKMKPVFESNATINDENEIHRKCAACEKEEKPTIQAKAEGSDQQPTSSSIESSLNASKGSGYSLPSGARAEMEDSFDADFSSVRIHNNSSAAQLSTTLHAQAFTHGSDIYFNSGKFDVDSTAGKRLLAHELTHVVQQGGSSVRTKLLSHNLSQTAVQRFPYWQAGHEGGYLTGKKIQSEIADELLPMYPQLFEEAPIPNGDILGVAEDKIGFADLYKAEGDRTIGFSFKGENAPAYLKEGGKQHRLRHGGGGYNHATTSAPTYQNGVFSREAQGPAWIKVGDIKPYGDLIGEKLWDTQLNNYIGGVKLAHRELKNFQKKESWKLKDAGKINESDVPTIPDKYRYNVAKGQTSRKLKLAGVPAKHNMLDRNITGKIFIAHNKDHSGILNYFWVLDAPLTATEMPPMMVGLWADYTKRLINPLKDSPLAVQPKREVNPPVVKAAVAEGIKNSDKNEIQRKTTDSFDLKKWNAEHTALRRRYLKLEKEKGYQNIEEELLANEAQEKINQKLRVSVPVNHTTAQEGNKKLHGHLDFWSGRGSLLIGVFRKIFGKAFIKVRSIYEWLKRKVNILAKGKGGMKSVPSGVMGAAIKVLFKAFKMAGVFLINEVVRLMIQALQEGVIKKIENYIESLLPETLTTKIIEVKQMISDLEAFAVKGVEDLVNSIFGTHLKIFETIEEISKLSNTIATIVSIVRWGVRIVECVSPPVVGCLWMLAEAVGDALLSQLVSSCWFMKKVYPHVLGLKILKDIPATIASSAVKTLNGWMPGPLKDIFAPINTGSVDANSFKPECGEGKEPTPDQKALQDLFESLGENKLYALQLLMEKGKINASQKLSIEDISAIRTTLESIDESKLKQVVENYPDEQPDAAGKSISLKDFLKKVEQQKDAALAQSGKTGTSPGQQVPAGTDPKVPSGDDTAQAGGQAADSENNPPAYAAEENTTSEKRAEAYVALARKFKSWDRVSVNKPYYHFKKPKDEIVVGDVIYVSIYGKFNSKTGFFTIARVKILNITDEPLSWNIQILWTDDAATTGGQLISRDQMKMAGVNRTVLAD